MANDNAHLEAAVRHILEAKLKGRGVPFDDRLMDRVVSRITTIVDEEVRREVGRASGS